jgi:ABC-2 type transport system ATP-binding protein
VEILEGFRERTAGEVSVLGVDPAARDHELRQQIGIVLQSTGIDAFLTVRETVEQYAGFFPAPRDLDEVVDLVGLGEKRETRVNKLSGGQQRRLDVAIALAGDPELLFLDEPTTGFDPNARRNAWEIVKNLTGLGKTVFLTTHYMDEAQYLADRVAVISHGEIVAEGPPSTLAGRDTMKARIVFRLRAGAAPPGLGEFAVDGGWEIEADDPVEPLHRLTGWALDRRVALDGLEVSRPSLEDVYLEITDGGGGSE